MNLSTTYLGLRLKNPLVASASPLSKNLAGIRSLEDAGAGAVVMYSLFEEQIDLESRQLDHYLNYNADSYAEAMNYFPDLANYNVGPDEYLEQIRAAKAATGIPIIGSLNGISRGGWMRYAKLIEDAGADALELNLYYIPTDEDLTGAQVEAMYLEALREVRASVEIPVAVKIGPQFSALANMTKQFAEAGANALVLFNRFYQPDFNLVELEVHPHLVLSTSHELRLPLRWIAILYGRHPIDFAISSGVHTHEDLVKAMMAGASVATLASELLANGVGRIQQILNDLMDWMDTYEYVSIQQMCGSMSQRNVAEPAAFERANYMKALGSWRQDTTGIPPV